LGTMSNVYAEQVANSYSATVPQTHGDDPWEALHNKQAALKLALNQEAHTKHTEMLYKPRNCQNQPDPEPEPEPAPAPEPIKPTITAVPDQALQPFLGTMHHPQVHMPGSQSVLAKSESLRGQSDNAAERELADELEKTRERLRLKAEQMDAERVARQEAKQTVALNRGYKSVLDPEDSKRGYHAAPADSSGLKETASQYTQRMLSAARLEAEQRGVSLSINTHSLSCPLQSTTPIWTGGYLSEVRTKVNQLSNSLADEC